MSQSAQVEKLIEKTIQTFGRLDYALNNAGVSMCPATTVELEEAEWDRVIGINLKSVWLCMRYEIPQMQKKASGSMLFIPALLSQA